MQRAVDLTKQLQDVSRQLACAHHEGKATLDMAASAAAPQNVSVQRKIDSNSLQARECSDGACKQTLLARVGRSAKGLTSDPLVGAALGSNVSSQNKSLDNGMSSAAMLQGGEPECQQRGAIVAKFGCATPSSPTPNPCAATTTNQLATCNVFLNEASACSQAHAWPLPLLNRTVSQPHSSHGRMQHIMQTRVQYSPRWEVEIARRSMSQTAPSSLLQQHDPMTATTSPPRTSRKPFNFRASPPKAEMSPPCTPRKAFHFRTSSALVASPPKVAPRSTLATRNVNLHLPEVWKLQQVIPRTTALKVALSPYNRVAPVDVVR